MLKFRNTGPRTKLPKSFGSLPPQPLVDLSALENFQPRPVNTFSVARNINTEFKARIPVFVDICLHIPIRALHKSPRST
jgi:hypothetical protein